MIDTHELKKRDLYLKKIIAFQDTEPVKVVTGIRRCGKSSLLKLTVAHLKENGIGDEQMIEMNFETYTFSKMSSDNYEKIVLSLNTGMDSSYEGIKSINLIDWLIDDC